MKKLIVGLLAAILMAAGLVGTTTTSAQAACTRYGGCPATVIDLSGPAVKNRGARITFTTAITVVGSNAKPRGTVRIVVKGAGTKVQGFRFSTSKKAKRVNQFTFGRRLKPGTYTVQAFFRSNGSQEDSSSNIQGLKVSKKRR